MALIVTTALTLAATASAHHSVNAEFDVNQNILVSGVLTRVDLVNPHTYMYFDVKTPSGKIEHWSFETGAPIALKQKGIAIRDTFIVGETYKVVYCPAKAGGQLGLLTSVTTPDGKFVAFGAANNVEAARELSK
jgi:hypothetical protein